MIALNKIVKISLLIIAIFFLGCVQFTQGLELEGKIHKNIYVKDIDLSHLSKKDAKEKINNILNENSKVNLIYNDDIYIIDLVDLEIKYNVDEAVEKAYQVGRENSLINDIKLKLGLDFGNKKKIDLAYNYNEDKIYDFINEINEKIYVAPINATAKVENNELVFTDEKSGIGIDKEKLKNDILNKVENIYCNGIKIYTNEIIPF